MKRLFIIFLLMNLSHILHAAPTPFKWQDLPVFTDEFHQEKGLRRIPLHINTGHIKNLQGLLVSGGIPIPENELSDINNLRVLDSAKKEIPYQAKALAYWSPGVIKWVFIEFRLQNNAGNPVYYLEYGEKVKSTVQAKPLSIIDTPKELIINTGKIKAVLSKKQGSLFEKIFMGDNNENILKSPISSFVKLKDIEGNRTGYYNSMLDKKPELKIEHHGSEEATILVRSWHYDKKARKSCPIDVRLTFFKNQAYIKLYHTFMISENPAIILFPSFGIKIPCPANSTVSTGVDSTTQKLDNNAVIYQDSSESYWYPDCNQFKPFCKLISGEKSISTGTKTDGWIQLSNNTSAISVFMKEMWQNFPKAYVIKDDFLTVEFWPEAKNEQMNMRRFDQGLRPDYTIFMETESLGIRGFNYNMRCYHKYMTLEEELSSSAFGIGKSHELWLDFSKKESNNPLRIKDIAETPLVPFVTPEWNSFTEACGLFHPFDSANFPKLEKSMEMHNRTLDKHRKDWFNWYGMWYWGDFQTDYFQEGYRFKGQRWGNLNTKYGWRNGGWCLPFGFYMQYLRAGNMDKFNTAAQVATKHMDVTSRHLRAWSDYRLLPEEVLKKWVGGGSRYDANGWGSTGGSSYDAQHSWVFGVALHYYLTGNHRGRDVVEEYLDAVDRGSKIYRLGMKYKIHDRTEDMATGIAAVGYEIDPLNKRNIKLFDFFAKHQAMGFDSIKIDENNRPYYSSNKARVSWHYKDYKGTSLMYMLAVKPDPNLIKSLINGHAKTYCNQFYNSLLLYYLCWKYSKNPIFAKMAWRLIAFKEYMNKDKIEKNMVLKPQVFGYNLIMNYFGLQAAYDIKEPLNIETPPDATLLRYPTGCRGPANQPLEDETIYKSIDIRNACNTSPFLTTDNAGSANEDFDKGPVQFDFGPLSRLESNYLPCDQNYYYPTSKNQKSDDDLLRALPFGAIARMRNVDFALIPPGINNGKGVMLLKKGQKLCVPINLKTGKLFLLTGVASGHDAFHNTPGATYTVNYGDGSSSSGVLENAKHYQLEGLYPLIFDYQYYAGTPSSFHLSVVPVTVDNKLVKSIDFEGQQKNAAIYILGITAKQTSQAKRNYILKKQFDETYQSNDCLSYKTTVPNGSYMLSMSVNIDPIGCPLDIWINGTLAMNHIKLWADTSLQLPVKITDQTLDIKLIPGEIHHKSKSAAATVILRSVSLSTLPKDVFLPVMDLTGNKQKSLAYGWKLRGHRAAIQDLYIKNFARQHETYVPADNICEDDGVFMSTGGVMKGEFIIDNVPPGKYKVTILARNKRSNSRVSIQLEDQKHDNITLLASDRLPGKVLGSINKPLTFTVDIHDGQFNLIFDMADKDKLSYKSWNIAGLILEKIK